MKAIFIMGSTGRVGFELTKHYLSKKYLVIAQCFRNCEKLEPLKSSHVNLKVLRHDFLKSGTIELVVRVRELSEELDSAVIIHPVFHELSNVSSKSLKELENEINEVIKTNLVAPLTLVYGLPPLLKEGGSIILLTDLLPIRGLRVYTTLKPSLPQLAASAALQSVISEAPKELPYKVRFFAVALGWLNVPGLRREDLKAVSESVPLRRPGKIKELVNLLDFLIEGAPEYLTGAVIKFSGGL